MKITPKTLNEWRIIPRIIIALYGYVFYDVINWYMGLPEPNNAQAMFISTIVGAAPAFFGLYVNSGSITTTSKPKQNIDDEGDIR